MDGALFLCFVCLMVVVKFNSSEMLGNEFLDGLDSDLETKISSIPAWVVDENTLMG